MAFISVTRLRIRSVFYLPQFIWHTLKSQRQVARSAGFLGGRLMRDPGNAFWTVTAWKDEAAMRAYRGSGAHMKAMPKLLDWCDEASIAHWEQNGAGLPEWSEAHRRMVAEGRMSKVRHPSQAQLAAKIAAPKNGGSEGQVLKPVEART
jgi:quinol monooxygenase YgiN